MIVDFDSNKIQIIFNNLDSDINEIIINGSGVTPLRIFKNSKGSIMVFVNKDLNFNIKNDMICGVHKVYGDFNGKINKELSFIPLTHEHSFDCNCSG